MKTQNATLSRNTLDELRGFIYKRVKDEAVAKDITQDVALKVFTRFDQLKDVEKLTGWMYRIARNAITDYFRNTAKAIDPRELDWQDNEYSRLTDCVQGCLQEMLTTLPEKYREALTLAELNSLSQTAIAEKLQISYSGAKSRVQRARQMLRDKMDAHYRIEMDRYGNVVVCEDRVPCRCEEKANC